MGRFEALFRFQEAEQRREQEENAVRNSESFRQLSRLHKTLVSQRATVTRLSDEMNARMLHVKRFTEKVENLERQLELEQSELDIISGDEESTAEEMTELRTDIEKLTREYQTAVREASGILQELEKAIEEYRSTGRSYKTNKEEYDRLREVCEKEKEEAAKALASKTTELEKLATEVDGELMKRYLRAKQHNGANPVVPVRDSKCSGCNMSLPTAALKRIRAEDGIVECENCGRILYVEK